MSNALNKVLLGKIETTPATDSVPAPATDAIRIISAALTTDTPPLESKVVKQTFGNMPHDQIKKALQLDVEFYLRSGGGLGVSPDFAPILFAGNHNITLNVAVSVVIDPVTKIGSARQTSSFYYYEDGLLWKFIGAMATFKMDAPIDDWVKCSASIFAPWADPTAQALPVGLVYQSSNPLRVDTTDVMTDNAGAISVGSFSFDSSGAVEVQRYTGEAVARMTDRLKPAITLTKRSLSTVADFTRLTTMTKAAFSAVFGSAGNRATLSGPNLQYESVKPVADGVTMNREIALAMYETAGGGDDAYQIKLH